jgi:NAD(P)-dependent dehydrogenase (short-subunit alcohol dehydrogenase family)
VLTISRIRWTPIPPRLLHDQGRPGRHGSSTLQPAHLQGYPSQVGFIHLVLEIVADSQRCLSRMKTWHNSPAPIGRIGQPSELGPAYVFLASQDGSFVSGQSIHVNGGAVVNG